MKKLYFHRTAIEIQKNGMAAKQNFSQILRDTSDLKKEWKATLSCLK